MATIDSNIKAILDSFIEVMKRERDVEAVYVYGSHVKGNAGPWSDIDIAIVTRNLPNDTFDEQIRLLHLAAEIDDRIEPHPFKLEDFDESDPMVNEILRTGIKIV